MTIDEACASFRALLLQQVCRVKAAECAVCREKKPGPVVIGLADGDGIGPILMAQARRVLQVLLRKELSCGEVRFEEVEGLTIENRLRLGVSLPPSVLRQFRSCDVLLKGPTTTPAGGTMESANVAIRREMDLFANVRPIRVPEKGIDWTFFRENTEGEYALGACGLDMDGVSVDFRMTSDFGTRRIARAAYDFAAANGKKRVTIVTKANILKKTDGRFLAVCREVASDYPCIETEERYVDAMAAGLLSDAARQKFEVILLPNLYGDILTDEAAELQGGIGSAGSANLGETFSMFEAVHGSAPDLVAAGLKEFADPRSILRAAAMLLRHIGKRAASERLEQAVSDCPRKDGVRCSDYCDAVLSKLEHGA